MAAIQSHWDVARDAATEYVRFAAEIQRIRDDTKLVRQGLKKLRAIVPDQARYQARLRRERQHEEWLPGDRQTVELRVQERMLGNRLDLQEACLLDKLVKFSRCVGRVQLADGGLGTGWLIAEGIMLTNHHVLPNARVAAQSTVRMGYERSAEGKPQDGQTFRLRPDLFFFTPRETPDGNEEVELDFALVGVAPLSEAGQPLTDYGFVTLDGAMGKVVEGENCMVIQHPQGDYKKVTLRDIRLLLITNQPDANKHLFYESDTLPGSSGAMVVALGTGEVIALHRAGVPQRDSNGNIIKKNGTIWRDGDSDEDVKWIANQGVRISKLVESIVAAQLPAGMRSRHQQLISVLQNRAAEHSGVAPAVPASEKPLISSSAVISPDQATVTGLGTRQRFFLKVSPLAMVREQVGRTLQQQFAGSQVEELAPVDERSQLATFLVVDLPGVTDPWATATQLEAVAGVQSATPDLPQYTTMPDRENVDEPPVPTQTKLPGVAEVWGAESFMQESLLGGLFGDKPWNEPKFIKDWEQARHVADAIKSKDTARMRRWNQWAIGLDKFPGGSLRQYLKDEGITALADLQLVQFDTGYTDHSKVRGGYDLAQDQDLISNDDDARDELTRGLLKFPGHGTRTGSLLIGQPQAADVVKGHDGNVGLLNELRTLDDQPAMRLIPFRVAKSVILIGQVKEVVDALRLALRAGADVITMSMGTLWNPLLEAAAYDAYHAGGIWCCAAGNYVRFVVAPAMYPGTIAVAASNPDDGPWSGSCRGPQVDITAPGEDVYVPRFIKKGKAQDMNYGSGTSYATPHVAAAALLWLAKYRKELGKYTQPWQKVEAFRYCLQKSARSVDTLSKADFGPGILDLKALLDMAPPEASKLKYAYSQGLSTTPAALQEVGAKDWARFTKEYIHGLLADPNAEADGAESMAPMAAGFTPPAQHFARALEKQAAPSAMLTESLSAMPPPAGLLASYARLEQLHALQAQLNPQY